jgi:GT2 family glycosyltransferase
MPKPLAVIPSYLSRVEDLNVLIKCLASLRATTTPEQLDIVVVDDGSPARTVVKALEERCKTLGVELILREENVGFSRTVNVGLRRALNEGRDAILINADLETPWPGWLELMQQQRSPDGEQLASIVGGLLLYGNGLIQFAGTAFSFLNRSFFHRYQFGPGDLPEAQVAIAGPVTGAFQFIRHECLQEIGIYDEKFQMSFEDVDMCIRAWKSGRAVVYQPAIRALHHESFFRGRGDPKVRLWEAESWQYFCEKWANENFAAFIPDLI